MIGIDTALFAVIVTAAIAAIGAWYT